MNPTSSLAFVNPIANYVYPVPYLTTSNYHYRLIMPIPNFCYFGPYDDRAFQCLLINNSCSSSPVTHLCSRLKRTYENSSPLEPETKQRIVNKGENRSIVPVFYPKESPSFTNRIKNTD